MSWFKDRKPLSFWQKLCIRILRTGKIPQHVAMIMDGNRRYARKVAREKIQGHIKGFEKLTQVLDWCLELGILEVTVYAFSIENFKRSEEEVNGLMKLAREKFTVLLDEKDTLYSEGVCIRVWGDITLLPADIQQRIAEVELLTSNNNRVFLNICMSYSSTEEICHSMREVVQGVRNGDIEPSDITEDTMSKCLYSGMSRYPEPDLLVRTSGEVRLSDFLLWQSTYTCISFLRVLWPDFTFWHLCIGIIFYQINYTHIQEMREQQQKWLALSHQRCGPSYGNGSLGSLSDDAVTAAYMPIGYLRANPASSDSYKEERVDAFIVGVRERRQQSLQCIVGHSDGTT